MANRRHFLKVLGGSAVAIGCGSGGDAGGGGGDDDGAAAVSSSSAGGGGGEAGGGPCSIDVGAASLAGSLSRFQGNGIHLVPGKTFLIVKDAGGYYAMTSFCTHQRCDMNQYGALKASNTRIECTCHNSVFDANGRAVSGLARQPLEHHALSMGCDGALYVDTSAIVEAATRLAVG